MSFIKPSIFAYIERILPAVGILITLVVHWKWYFSTGLLAYADWGYPYRLATFDWVQILYAWNPQGLGSVNVTGSFFPLTFFMMLFAPDNFAIQERLLFLWPIPILLFISPYLLIKHYTDSRLAAFMAALFYSCNTYVVVLSTQHLTILGAFALAPMVMLVVHRLYEKANPQNLSLFVISSVVLGFYDFRILYITYALVISWAIFALWSKQVCWSSWASSSIRLCVGILAVVALNLFWLMGTAAGGQLTGNSVLSRSLFGGEFLPLMNGLTLSHGFWTYDGLRWFTVNPPSLLAWGVLAIVVAILVTQNRNKLVVFFGVVAAIGLFLSKQDNPPFGEVYFWLYNHLPGFNAFREASKFYLLTALSYSVLIGFFISRFGIGLKWRKIAITAACIYVPLLAFVNIRPLVMGDPKTLFEARQVPAEYQTLATETRADQNFYRTLWAPIVPRWAVSDFNHPALGLSELLPPDGAGKVAILDQVRKYFNSPYAQYQLTKSAVKYVIVPLRDTTNDDDFFINYGHDRDEYLEALNGVEWLIRQPNIGGLAIYKLDSLPEKISAYESVVKLISPLPKEVAYEQARSAGLIRNSTNISFSNDASELGLRKNGVLMDLSSVALLSPYITSAKSNSEVGAGDGKVVKVVRTKYTATITEDELAVSSRKLTHLKSTPTQAEKEVLRTSRTPGKDYFIEHNGVIAKIPTGSLGSLNIGTYEGELGFFSSPDQGVSLLSSVGKEIRIDNCKTGEDRDEFGTARFKSSSGEVSYRGRAYDKACVTIDNPVSVLGGQKYLITFTAKQKGSQRVGYKITFNDPARTVSERPFSISGDRRMILRDSFIPPQGATEATISLIGYPDDANRGIPELAFSDLKLLPTQPLAAISSVTAVEDVGSSLDEQIRKIRDGLSEQNKVVNGSFEDGLWQKQVGDCNAFDSRNDVQMRLVKTEKTNGNNSLELSASSHIACTSAQLSTITPSAKYLLQFDYKSTGTSGAGINIDFAGSSTLPFTRKYSDTAEKWHHVSEVISVPLDSTKATITVYGYGGQYDSRISTYYDNIRLVEVQDEALGYYFDRDSFGSQAAKLQTKVKIINPVNNTIDIVGASQDFYVLHSETYSPKWRLSFNNDKQNKASVAFPWGELDTVSSESHFVYAGFGNGWFVDIDKHCRQQKLCQQNPDGSFNISLIADYSSQSWFNLGAVISISTLVVLSTYISLRMLSMRRRVGVRRQKQNSPKNNPHANVTSAHSGRSSIARNINRDIRRRSPGRSQKET